MFSAPQANDRPVPNTARPLHRFLDYGAIQNAHKTLLPLSVADALGFALAMLGLLIASGSGIGGGGLLVPIYVLVWDFTPKYAVPLSNITVLGGAVANFILNVSKRHPQADRPLISWDLVLIMEPLTVAGALMGAFANKAIPESLLSILLVALLTITGSSTLKKAVELHHKETACMLSQETRRLQDELDDLLVVHGVAAEASDILPSYGATMSAAQLTVRESDAENAMANNEKALRHELRAILEYERRVPRKNVFLLVFMFAAVLAMNVLKGGGALPSPVGITCGSTAFWLSNLLMLLFLFSLALYARHYLLTQYHRKQAVRYQYMAGDVEWNERNSVAYPALSTLAGFFAGLFGVGGGIVKGPLMLAMGMHPTVCAASSACMILFTSFAASTSFLLFGLLTPDYGSVCLCVGFITTYCGQVAINHFMKKTNRTSYIAFSVGGVVILSAVLMSIQSMISIWNGNRVNVKDLHGICSVGP
jgi:uncharacterized membrane protein YfcA